MIVAYTQHDGATFILARVAEEFVSAVHTLSEVITPPHCLGASISAALKDNDLPLVFFGHGQDPQKGPHGFFGQDGQLALDATHHPALANRVVIGICCFSAAFLEECRTRQPAAEITSLGFQGLLGMPLVPPRPAAKLDPKEWSRRVQRCLFWSRRVQRCLSEGMQQLLQGGPLSSVADVLKGAFEFAAWELRRAYQKLPDPWSQEAFDLVAFQAAFASNAKQVVVKGKRDWSLPLP
jgi:hypothetical protein